MAGGGLLLPLSRLHNGPMADLVYLSIWLRDFSESNMLQHWQRVMEAFPVSASSSGVRSLTIYPFNWSETPVLERSFGEGTSAEDLVSLASEFLHQDYAYEAELKWDLWLPSDSAEAGQAPAPETHNGPFLAEDTESEEYLGSTAEDVEESAGRWRRVPAVVSVACVGPQFENEAPEDRSDIQIGFGLDSPFLPLEEDLLSEDDLDFDPDMTELRIRENLQQLVEFVHRLDETLPIKKRLLWCESGVNLADKILGAYKDSDK